MYCLRTTPWGLFFSHLAYTQGCKGDCCTTCRESKGGQRCCKCEGMDCARSNRVDFSATGANAEDAIFRCSDGHKYLIHEGVPYKMVPNGFQGWDPMVCFLSGGPTAAEPNNTQGLKKWFNPNNTTARNLSAASSAVMAEFACHGQDATDGPCAKCGKTPWVPPPTLAIGDKCLARFQGQGEYAPAIVEDADFDAGIFSVRFDDGRFDEMAEAGWLKAAK